MRGFLSACCVTIPGVFATAQTATVDVSHNDPDGVVLPGETIRITARHARSGSSFLAGIGGDLRATGDLGSASNVYSDLRLLVHSQIYPASHGTAAGGSVVGISYEFVSHPLFVTSVQPPYVMWPGIEALSYDWTAPVVSQPTTVSFDWVPSAAFPDVYAIIPPYNELHWAFLPTTYTGTSLIVLPTPATLGVLGLGFFVPRRRR
ncbi:MAG: hypothetical protein KDA05_00010 [Phycisphaerales bacterium]|nr:hypothetical protein [Phycisphaerales bacterium]